VVLVAVGLLSVMEAQHVIGANIGAGLALLVVGSVGLPWSWIDVGLGWWPNHGGDKAQISFLAFCALLNLVLHATLATLMTVWPARTVVTTSDDDRALP
jgi:hypothetical protein